VELQDITLSLPADLIEQAQVYAAKRATSINSIVRALLEDALTRQEQTRLAGAQFLQLAEAAPLSDFDPGSISRDEIYERR